MKFETTEALIEYINIIGNDRLKHFDIKFTPISETKDEVNLPITEAVGGTDTDLKQEDSVSILSLSSSPSVTAKLVDLEENVIYVDSYESIPLSCSTGKVSLLNRDIYCNVCEADESGPVIHLSIQINESKYANVPFKLKKSLDSNSDYIMLLNPKTLSSHE